ncbi:hypothetical protein [Deinococcus sp.]|uniref:hypothetical protein n=1 Tax=Deinococcus sp. TaxID=47478 RepID=UPI0025E63ADD|nr:hypothetical protein [Deinococcus sp.]
MSEFLVKLPTRPAFALASLSRAGLGEIVVRKAGKFVSRQYFPSTVCLDCGGVLLGNSICDDCLETRR